MDLSFITLAATTAANPLSAITSFALIPIMFVALYFFMIRPQRKKQKDEEKMRNNLQIGDEIITIGGFYGRVISIKDDSVVFESMSDRTKNKIARWAIQQNLTVHDEKQ